MRFHNRCEFTLEHKIEVDLMISDNESSLKLTYNKMCPVQLMEEREEKRIQKLPTEIVVISEFLSDGATASLRQQVLLM